MLYWKKMFNNKWTVYYCCNCVGQARTNYCPKAYQ